MGTTDWRPFVLLLLLTVGCQTFKKASWVPPQVTIPVRTLSPPGSPSAAAELALAEAVAAENQGNPACVDHYFQAATLAWQELNRQGYQPAALASPAGQVYHAAVTQLVAAGQHFQRFDPRRGLRVWTSGGWCNVATRYQGFVWGPDDVDFLMPVGDYAASELHHLYRNSGLGVAMVAAHYRRPEERFRRTSQVFAATAVLQPACDGSATPADFVLDLFDPLRISTITTAAGPVSLARDLSAPLVYRMSQQNRDYVTRFFQPGTTDQNADLFMLEPYQRGKIPVIFIHGLLSDPLTWANLANEIQAQPDLLERYQMWGFEYATGAPFLASAAVLRMQLQEIVATVDPYGTDEAMANMVLVGHSMGGLIAKLQITQSDNQLWEAVSSVPLERIVTSPVARSKLRRSFYFQPSGMISRVVFIGTPHRGSPWARRPVGRLGSLLVEESPLVQSTHDLLVCDNPNAFSREFTRRVPTSIDLLESSSPLLQAIDQLPRDPRVQLHTVYGCGYWILGGGNSDSVVPVEKCADRGRRHGESD